MVLLFVLLEGHKHAARSAVVLDALCVCVCVLYCVFYGNWREALSFCGT